MRFTPIDIACQQCGRLNRVTQKRDAARKFCDHTCYRAYEAVHGRPQEVEITEFKCAQCETSFFRKPGELRQYHATFGKDPLYCSRVCAGLAKRRMKTENCVECGTKMTAVWRDGRTRNGRSIVCSSECRKKRHTRKMLEFNADKEFKPFVGRHGYMRISVRKEIGQKAVSVLEHRHVMEQSLGRDLFPHETVHHVNGSRTDNRLENLELFSSRHGPGQRVIDKIEFAVDMLRLYPEFAARLGVRLVEIEPLDGVAIAAATGMVCA